VLDFESNAPTKSESSSISTKLTRRCDSFAGDRRPKRVHAVVAKDVVGSSNTVVEAIYRVIELLVCTIGLILSLPLLLLIGALIRLDSPGPALFLQVRPGRSIRAKGRDLEGRADLEPPPGGYQPDSLYYVPSYFRLAKFRTMFIDAKTRFPELYRFDFDVEEFHNHFPKSPSDPRVTRVGRILRKLSLDELPNLWNVILGQMRLVGPRPEHPDVLQFYRPEEMYKFSCKPGVTGLAQAKGRSSLNWGQALALDLEYVHNRSVLFDLGIILLSIKAVLLQQGAF